MSSEHKVQLQPAYLLHRKPYRDTSLLLELFSRDHGRIGLIARGARGAKSKLKGVLQPYQPLLVSWSGRGELQTLTSAETEGSALFLQGDTLASGFYLNELLMRLLARHDPHPDLYHIYHSTLQRISANHDIEWALRLFERDLLQELGYGLLLNHEGRGGVEVVPEGRYCYYHESGPQRMHGEEGGRLTVSGETLLALAQGRCEVPQLRRESKLLMREVLARYLGNRPLASRELFRQKRPKRNEETGVE
ncbi:MAG: DNA repair protein RecO [Chromatiales bacterium]|nr:DNA repair protein RecO [Chromatiales bacterium]